MRLTPKELDDLFEIIQFLRNRKGRHARHSAFPPPLCYWFNPSMKPFRQGVLKFYRGEWYLCKGWKSWLYRE